MEYAPAAVLQPNLDNGSWFRCFRERGKAPQVGAAGGLTSYTGGTNPHGSLFGIVVSPPSRSAGRRKCKNICAMEKMMFRRIRSSQQYFARAWTVSDHAPHSRIPAYSRVAHAVIHRVDISRVRTHGLHASLQWHRWRISTASCLLISMSLL